MYGMLVSTQKITLRDFGHAALHALVVVVACTAYPHSARAEQIRIGGTGGALATMRILGDAYQKAQPGARIIVVPNLGSSGGIKAVIAGAIEISVSSRPLRESETRQGGKAVEYGRTPFVFATSGKTAGVASLTLRQVVDIYAAKADRWPDGTRIRLVLRPDNDSDSELLKSISRDLRDATEAAAKRPGMLVAITDNDAADSLERLPGSFGTTTLALILSEKRALKTLALDGIEPTVRAVADGSYPYWKPMLLVTGPKPGSAANAFIDFVRSAAGREILARTGHWVK